MAFTSLTAQEVQATRPTLASTGDLIRTNLDDLDSRLTAAETAVNTYRPIEFTVPIPVAPYVPIDEVLVERISFDINVLSGRILVIDAGTAGTLECDLEYKRGAGAWTSIFSTLPSVAFGDGDYALSTDGVLTTDVATNGLDAGDLLRLNVDTAQTGNNQFKVIVEFEKA